MKFFFLKLIDVAIKFINEPNFRNYFFLVIKLSNRKRYNYIKNIKFSKYSIDIPDTLSFLGQYKELFINQNYYFSSSDQSPTIIDCGSNIGMSIIYFKSIYPFANIYGFEPDPYLYNILKKNLKKNKIYDVKLSESAVWTNEKIINFLSDGADGGHISETSVNTKIKIKSTRLKNFLDKFQKIDLLKLDIEGSETDVLLDCSESLKKIDNLFVEYHSFSKKNQDLSKILNLFEMNNFRYHIETVYAKKKPFLRSNFQKNFDLQLNIYCNRAIN